MSVITSTGNKTLSADNDANMLQRVIAAAVIKIPADDFLVNDWIDVFRDSTGAVSVVAESTSVTISAIGPNINKQCGFAKYVKIDTNKWIGWGDLST